MNPRLIKFAVELQNAEKVQEEKTSINFKNGNGGKKYFNFFKLAKVTVPVNRNN